MESSGRGIDPGMRYRHRAPRCEHGFYAGLCLEPTCPHWDGIVDVVRQQLAVYKSRRRLVRGAAPRGRAALGRA